MPLSERMGATSTDSVKISLFEQLKHGSIVADSQSETPKEHYMSAPRSFPAPQFALEASPSLCSTVIGLETREEDLNDAAFDGCSDACASATISDKEAMPGTDDEEMFAARCDRYRREECLNDDAFDGCSDASAGATISDKEAMPDTDDEEMFAACCDRYRQTLGNQLHVGSPSAPLAPSRTLFAVPMVGFFCPAMHAPETQHVAGTDGMLSATQLNSSSRGGTTPLSDTTSTDDSSEASLRTVDEAPSPMSASAADADNVIADDWSVGSAGHPHTCAAPCKYHSKKGRVCKEGANCNHCHICLWERSSGEWRRQTAAVVARRALKKAARTKNALSKLETADGEAPEAPKMNVSWKAARKLVQMTDRLVLQETEEIREVAGKESRLVASSETQEEDAARVHKE